MKVNVQAVNFNVDRKLVDFTQERLDKLEKFYDKIVSSEVFLKVENTSDKENNYWFKRGAFISKLHMVRRV